MTIHTTEHNSQNRYMPSLTPKEHAFADKVHKDRQAHAQDGFERDTPTPNEGVAQLIHAMHDPLFRANVIPPEDL